MKSAALSFFIALCVSLVLQGVELAMNIELAFGVRLLIVVPLVLLIGYMVEVNER